MRAFKNFIKTTSGDLEELYTLVDRLTTLDKADKQAKLLIKTLKKSYVSGKGLIGDDIELVSNSLNNFENLSLETAVPSDYKFLISDMTLKTTAKLIKDMVEEVKKGNFNTYQDNIKLFTLYYLVYYAVLMALVRSFVSLVIRDAVNAKADVRLKFKDLGLSNNVFKYMKEFKPLLEKGVSDWKTSTDITTSEMNYFMMTSIRILSILNVPMGVEDEE